ncbi:hypothetical protein PMY56_13575 [Clostridium tertium]|uniref:hypothetical protein n=1 Tax=Clostridium TaxID=1485 RepID=UPI00232B1F5D|nr:MULTISPECIES: hypothetical protein [Clostridium]MBS4959039.1 hypothetical protein [Clostridium sp.]MDB1924072.1 hypothetical protein [Clostridium tertium]MDB1927167.1 hypothetical protein [Clostridium tertium]MDB1930944.1 hypothetical protein [Clostridium tertium]
MMKNIKIKLNDILSIVLILTLISYIIVDIYKIRTNKNIIETNYKLIDMQEEINKEIEGILKYVKEL